MIWTDEQADTLKELWADGCSARNIAQRFGDLTRNAVLGKVHRMGLPKRKVMDAPKQRRVPSSRRRPVPTSRPMYGPPVEAAPFQAREAALSPLHLSLQELTPTSCRYPYGEQQYTFCGYEVAEQQSYCAVHSKIVYMPAKSRKAVPA